ncbi:hypothetical protein GCM10009792_17040 [Microcella alkalica]
MASEALGGSYVLTNEGAEQLAALAAESSAPVSSPGFASRSYDSLSVGTRLSVLESLVRHRTAS